MKKCNEAIEKKSRGSKLIEWAKDHTTGICITAVYGVAVIVTTYTGIKMCKENKRLMTLWDAAMNAYRSGNKDYDYGPFKVAEFSEPFGEKIGDVLLNQDWIEIFLNSNK